MEFLLFTLTVGSFLMVFPYLSEGGQIKIGIPSYISVGSELKVTCSYSGNQITDVELLHGDTKSSAVLIIDQGIFDSKSNIQSRPGASVKSGSLTFIFSRVDCKDFTWYMCKTKDRLEVVESNNQTLQVLPYVNSIETKSVSAVHEMSTFTCEGTVRKEGPYSVEWYRTAITSTNRLTNQTEKVFNENTCSRRILSTLTYNVSEYDTPNLLLWCQITSGKSFEKNASFPVQELTTIAASVTPQPVKAGLDPGSIVGIVLGVTAIIVLVVLLVWFLVIRPKRLKADGPSKDKGPEPNAKDYQKEDEKGEVNPAMDDKNDADNAPYTVYPPSEYHNAGGHSNPAMDDEMSNHMSGSQV